MAEVLVVGAGPAGLAAAGALVRAGVQVELVERDAAPGGRWGMAAPGVERGPHVLPAWYENVRRELRRLEVPLVDLDGLSLLDPGGVSTLTSLAPPRSLGDAVRLLTRAPLGPADAVAHFALIADLLADSGAGDRSRREAVSARRWVPPRVAELDAAIVTASLGMGADRISARTLRTAMGYIARQPVPWLSALPGPVDELLLDPWLARFRGGGGVFTPSAEVTGVEGLDGAPRVHIGDTTRRPDAVVLATPVEVTRRLLGNRLPGLHRLAVAPMPALDLALAAPIPGLPPGPILLRGARFGLVIVELGQLFGGPSVLSVAITGAGEGDAEAVEAEVLRYLPEARVVDRRWRSNVACPLFVNTVDSWADRAPGGAADRPRVFLAGDHVRNPIDIAGLEGATWTGLQAARLAARAVGAPRDVPAPTTPPTWPARALSAVAGVSRAAASVAAFVAGRAGPR